MYGKDRYTVKRSELEDDRCRLVLDAFAEYLSQKEEFCVVRTERYGYVILSDIVEDYFESNIICRTAEDLYQELYHRCRLDFLYQSGVENGCSTFEESEQSLTETQKRKWKEIEENYLVIRDRILGDRREEEKMARFELYQEENEASVERYELASERLAELVTEREETLQDAVMKEFFAWSIAHCNGVIRLVEALEQGKYQQLSMAELEKWNEWIYDIRRPGRYEESWMDPSYAVGRAGEKLGGILSAVAWELSDAMVTYAFRGNRYLVTTYLELVLQLYHMAEEDVPVREWEEAWYYFQYDYREDRRRDQFRHMYVPAYAQEKEIVEKADLTDLRYLYQYGLPVTENEKKIAEFLNGMSQEQIDAMAYTYTNGYYKGFQAYKIDLTKKSIVQIRYPLGFERMVRAAVQQFRQMGLEAAYLVSSTSINRQAAFDHKYDLALVLDKNYVEISVASAKKVFDEIRESAAVYAGPAVIETFGETPFEPVKKPEASAYNEKQRELSVGLSNELGIMANEYIPGEETSFTIIAYPIPEIGVQFEEIFAETVRVNTLDSDTYRNIQQCLIDVLDQGEYVRVLGSGKNRTDLKIMLHTLTDPEKQTNFENCLDDVNIPVGEVFTSPLLKGTEGTLHVTDVYLNGLRYLDLDLKLEDGMIRGYACGNFETEEENRKYIEENLLFHHDSLPIGEFAIGTNTTAYVMGLKYDIQGKLPILIAEKTGPHFAMGDTCYSRSEDHVVYNPDGKEIIARDNECSLLRKTDISKAYFNCHTDITLPYNELGEISVYKKNGEVITLIRDGRFVLPGTEELNKALDTLS